MMRKHVLQNVLLIASLILAIGFSQRSKAHEENTLKKQLLQTLTTRQTTMILSKLLGTHVTVCSKHLERKNWNSYKTNDKQAHVEVRMAKYILNNNLWIVVWRRYKTGKPKGKLGITSGFWHNGKPIVAGQYAILFSSYSDGDVSVDTVKIKDFVGVDSKQLRLDISRFNSGNKFWGGMTTMYLFDVSSVKLLCKIPRGGWWQSLNGGPVEDKRRNIKFVDLNGDGLSEILVTKQSGKLYATYQFKKDKQNYVLIKEKSPGLE